LNAAVLPPLLRENRNFRRYFVGQAVSLLGDQVTLVALPLTAVLALHASAGQMGALTTVALIPNLVCSLYAGSWVDKRGNRRVVMLAADLGRGLLISTIPIAYALGHLSWALLYVVAFGSGVLSVFFYVAYGGFFQTIVSREDYIAANSLSNGTRAFAFLGGTSLGGVLVQLFRGPYALAVDGVSFVWSAFFLGRVDAPDPPAAEHREGGVLAGARWIRASAIIRAELLGVATINFFNFMFFALFMLYATRSLGVRPATIGFVLGGASVGTILGSFVTAPLSRKVGVGVTFLAGCFLFPAPLILVPAAGGPYWLVLACLFVSEFFSGLGVMLLDIMAGAINASLIPPTLRSRVSGAFMMVNYGVRPLGTAIAGVLGSQVGVRPTLWVATVGGLAGMLFLLPSPIRALRELPEEAAP
jgi:MFS family permease